MLDVVLQKDKLCVQIVMSGLVSAGLPCSWFGVVSKCRLTRQLGGNGDGVSQSDFILILNAIFWSYGLFCR